MNIKTIIENIEELANENMTEDHIHHDDWTDHEAHYQSEILKGLLEHFEVESEYELPGQKETLEALDTLTIRK